MKRWEQRKLIDFDESDLRIIQYRPFTKKWVNNLRPLIKRPSFWNNAFGENNNENNLFLNIGSGERNSVLISQDISDYQLLFNTKSIPYKTFNNSIFEEEQINIRDIWKSEFKKEIHVLYYIYGVLHSLDYREKYANDLRKTLPRIPLLKYKDEYVRVGKALIELHLNYENQPKWPSVEVITNSSNTSYLVNKMRHPKKDELNTIIFNADITIKNIPVRAYNYIVNGKSGIGWIMDQYRIKTDKKQES